MKKTKLVAAMIGLSLLGGMSTIVYAKTSDPLITENMSANEVAVDMNTKALIGVASLFGIIGLSGFNFLEKGKNEAKAQNFC